MHLKKRKDRGTPSQGLDAAAFSGTCCRTATSCIMLATLFFPTEAAAEFLAPPAQWVKGPWVQFCNLIISGNLLYGWLG